MTLVGLTLETSPDFVLDGNFRISWHQINGDESGKRLTTKKENEVEVNKMGAIYKFEVQSDDECASELYDSEPSVIYHMTGE